MDNEIFIQGKINCEDFAEEVFTLMKTRRSIRDFLDKDIPADMLDKIVTAGRLAPSARNFQTWRFTVIQEKEEISLLRDTTKEVAQKQDKLFYGFMNPQTLVIVSNDRRNGWGIQDSSAAIENMLLMAHAQKLGAVWINTLLEISDEPEIRILLDKYGIPKRHIVYGIVAIGYPKGMVKAPGKKENVISYYNSSKK